MRKFFGLAAGLLALGLSASSFAASIVDVKNYKRHNVAVENDVAVKIVVRSESTSPSKILIRKIDDSLFVASIVSNRDIEVSVAQEVESEESVIVAGESSKIVSMLAPEELSVSVESINHPPVDRTGCMAYWVGFVFDQEKGRCIQRAASGCRNPFKYESMQKCQEARL